MTIARTAGFALATVALVAALAFAARPLDVEESAGEGAVAVSVTGPAREVIFGGSVAIEDPSAYSVLVAASEAGSFEVRTREYPGLGLYVESVAGHDAQGSSGWVYEVLRDGEWASGDRAADRFTVAPGESVRWFWSAAPPQ